MAFSARLTDTGIGLRAEVDTNTSQLAQKANSAQPAWIEPTLLNGWSNASGYTTRYMKDTIGFVTAEVHVTGGTINVPTFTFSAGYMPSQPVYVTGVTTAIYGYVAADGNFYQQTGSGVGNSRFLIRFKAV